MADMGPVNQIARMHGLFVLEDAAQAIGARYYEHPAGSLGHAGALSFYPSKNLGGFGDGGMMVTNDLELARSLARLRVHGMEPKYHHHEVGFNSRLDALQAAVLRVKLCHLEAWTNKRRLAAARYQNLFEHHRLTGTIGLPRERDGYYHVYNQFIIRVPASVRDALREHLAGCQIGTEIYYPIPLHLQPCFSALGHKSGDFPRSEAAARETIALPIYPELSEEQQNFVVGSIRQFIDSHAHLAASPRAA
jgi:dTDP-4-amino-4,6-dideoxygalactose transaminase